MKKVMSKLLCVLLVVCMVLPMVPTNVFAATIVDSGTCGENLTWTLDRNGLLTISGSGEMFHYHTSETANTLSPWHYSGVKQVVIQTGVTSIGNYAFWGEDITSITIPDSVTSIGDYAFELCSNLTSIDIPDSVTSIGDDAFGNCHALTSIIIPNGVASIGRGVFRGCSRLLSITIPSSVVNIGQGAFSHCESLANITIPDGVTEIGFGAFEYCLNLQSVTIPNGVISLGDSAFTGCSNLTNIAIPDGVTRIGHYTFRDCTKLSSILISDSVTSIGYGATLNCPALTDVYYLGSEEHWKQIAIDWGNDDLLNATIHFDDRNTPEVGNAVGDKLPSTKLPVLSNNGLTGTTIDPTDTGKVTVINFWGAWCGTSMIQLGILDQIAREYNDLVNVVAIHTELMHMDAPEALAMFYPNSSVILAVDDENETYHRASGGKGEYPYTIIVDENGIVLAKFERIAEYEEIRKIISEAVSNGSNGGNSPGDNPGENNSSAGKLVVYSDYTNLSINTGSTITLSAGIQLNGTLSADVSNITFQIADTSILKVTDTGISGNCRYVKLKGLQKGTTTVAFTDAQTGKTITVPVTVSDNHYHSYTLSNVPTQYIEKYPTNFYNVNGLYVDSYQYSVNTDGSATVFFDVYNTNYTYGTVEVFDQNGNLDSLVLIDKMTSSNTGIKEAVWDNLVYLVRDLIDGDFLTYRQESGYSVCTPVHVTIPENGYLRICIDPEASFIVGLVNAADIIMQLNEIAGGVQGFKANSKEFAEKLTTNLLSSKIYAQYLKDGSSFPKKLMQNVSKEAVTTSVSLSTFTETIANNLAALNMTEIIFSTGASVGISVSEKVFMDLSGWLGDALEILFVSGKSVNVIIQHSDYTQAQDKGSIYIQNQGGGIRSSQQIFVESVTELDAEASLNVFTVTLDSAIVNAMKETNRELYEALMKGKTYTYNISLLKDGQETQPDGKVTVYIPIPEDMHLLAYAGQVKIYRSEENGTMTPMDVSIQDGCFVFTTDHFSLYTLVGYDAESDVFNQVDEPSKSPTMWVVVVVAVIVAAGVSAAVTVMCSKKKKST